MKPREMRSLLRVNRPPAPYGVRRLSRCSSIDDLADLARRRLPRAVLGYLEGGGEAEYTLRRNGAAFADYEIVPRALQDVRHIDTSSSVFGMPIPLPILLGPVGAPRLLHHEGELAAVRAAAAARVPYCVSTLATVGIDRIARETSAPLCLQLYVWGDRGIAKDLIGQAETLGVRALLLSVDVSVRSKRERELRAGLTLPSPHITLATVVEAARRPTWSWHFLTSDAVTFPNVDPHVAVATNVDMESMFDGSLTWRDVDWIRDAWRGPLALKGVLSPRDAARATDHGIDTIIVSNHGGRQLDHVPATIDVLAGVVDAVAGRADVLLDSGIRRGTDILTALALGARAVLIGRGYLYGLAAAGEAGVRLAIDILADELRTAMALAGAPTIDAIDSTLVRRRTPISP